MEERPSSSAKVVLVVEDEWDARDSMVSALWALEGVDVVEASTLKDAAEILDTTMPSVVVADVDLPDGAGVQLVGELVNRQIKVPLVFVTTHRREDMHVLTPDAVVVVEKPIAADALSSIVARLLATGPPAHALTVADLAQLACMGFHGATIDVEWRDGGGNIEVAQGTLWSANDARGKGEDAFRRLAFRRDVRVNCTTLETPLAPRNIERPWATVLNESVRLHEESPSAPVIEAPSESEPPPAVAPRAPYPPHAVTLPSMGAVRDEPSKR
jgi:CheY-like chemotaxis protein